MIAFDQVDFRHCISDGMTVYSKLFQAFRFAFRSRRTEADLVKIITKFEIIFFMLVDEGKKYGFDVDAILAIPSDAGTTCFQLASTALCKTVCKYIIGRGIKVNSIQLDMQTPSFSIPDLVIPMLTKGNNPYVQDREGRSQLNFYRDNFKGAEAKRLLAQLPRSIHFSIDDIACLKSCVPDCPSKFEKFYYKNGEFVKMIDANRIGQGGFGSVFKGLFHGEYKAMKCVLIGAIEDPGNMGQTSDAVSNLEKNISEIRVQVASSGSGVIAPEAFVRQQNQEQDAYGKWVARNYNIFIYPLYDCNLYELHENNFDQFTEAIIADIIHQCFIRIGSLKFFT